MWVTTSKTKTLSLQHCPTDEMLADYFTKPLQGSLFVHLRNHIMGAEFEDGNPKTHRSVLGYQDDHENNEASERDQEASEWDQNEILVRDQNNKNACDASTARDQNNENACDASTAWGQNNENVCGASMHLEEATIQKEKQMTYREALLGLDNSELGSDF